MKFKYFMIKNGGKACGIVCVGAYMGKYIKGCAKCDPSDEFDYEKGKKLAEYRCLSKIAEKRSTRMHQRVNAVQNQIDQLEKEIKNLKDKLGIEKDRMMLVDDEYADTVSRLCDIESALD